MAAPHSTSHILQSLFVNILIAVAKFIAAIYTASGAMLAEAIHSAADSVNQLLLLLGVWRSRKPPTAKHPLGFGRALYFWSFIVALLLFTGGGIFSIYEGLHKFNHPEPLENLWIAFGVLLFALLLEGYATRSNILEIHRRRGTKSFFKYLTETKDSDLVVVFGENAAATLGLALALLSLTIAAATEDSRWDAVGSMSIGVVLVGVALFLAVEVKSLLVGERAAPEVEEFVRSLATSHTGVTNLLHILTLQQGPGQVILLLKLGFVETLTINELASTIDGFEKRVREKYPEVRWCFIEPDRPRG